MTKQEKTTKDNQDQKLTQKAAAQSPIPTTETETEFRIGVINRSGNVGKTSISRLLLAPRMSGIDDIIYIETTNADKESADSGKMVRAAQFEKVAHKLGEAMSAIVDIGSSNFEQTLELMRQIEGSHEDFDYLLVPVTKSPKPREDTIKTLVDIVNMGFDSERIKVVFNRVGLTESIDEEFADVIFAMKKLGIEYNKQAVIYENNFFPKIHSMGLTLADLFSTSIQDNKLRQNTLRRMKQRTQEDSTELSQLTSKITLQRNAVSSIDNLDHVYNTLFTSNL